jgi:hypothetical protein
VTNTLKFSRNGAVGFIDWLDLLMSLLITASAAPNAVHAEGGKHQATDVALNGENVSSTKSRGIAQRLFDINGAGKESAQENKADTDNPRLSCSTIRVFPRGVEA